MIVAHFRDLGQSHRPGAEWYDRGPAQVVVVAQVGTAEHRHPGQGATQDRRGGTYRHFRVTRFKCKLKIKGVTKLVKIRKKLEKKK